MLAAKEQSSSIAQEALSTLCRTYWYPLFSHLRRRGFDFAQAEDLTQSFFASVLEGAFFNNVDREKGRFRHFLLAALRNHVAQHHRTNLAQKRGGGQAPLSLDFQSAEARYQMEPFHELSADELFEHQWALTLFDQVLQQLEQECEGEGKSELFQCVKSSLDGTKTTPYRELAQRLKMNEGAVKVAIHRLRQRFGHIFREQIACTVAHPDEVDEEIRAVFRSLQVRA